MKYDYRKEMRKDINNYIDENYSAEYLQELFNDYDNDYIYEKFYDELWIADSVTGNGSGSYTFNSFLAGEYVKSNIELLVEACKEFGIIEDEFYNKFMLNEWEYFDVTIRCYLLGSILYDVLAGWRDAFID